ncbi:uncharacterized protein LOC108830847 [Raphanus sativus]|uniref:Uncharacterized protein LOC108830847 n=1 Tax=Raphanus sativus TaxID=3726 RepID=A0A6J0LJR1_RAPSA|nr:uncharacterized protein LOC108830847 [Raphanus sativus]
MKNLFTVFRSCRLIYLLIIRITPTTDSSPYTPLKIYQLMINPSTLQYELLIFNAGEDVYDQLLLSRIISQLESPNPFQKVVDTTREEEESSLPSKGKAKGERQLEETIEEIAKDIKEMKRQNKVTHILLSAMILQTLNWQLSEYSMIYMLKERLTHPIS